jgi:hypothetical protein
MDPVDPSQRAGSRFTLEVDENRSPWLVAMARITFAWLVTIMMSSGGRPEAVPAGEKVSVKLMDRKTGHVVWRSVLPSDDDALETTTTALREDLAQLDVRAFVEKHRIEGLEGLDDR